MREQHVDGVHARAGVTRAPDGVAIAWFADGSGRPLVLVHGTAADHTTWRASGPVLARSFETRAIDRRGRGGSADAPDYAIEREFDDLAAVVEEIADERGPVDVVGHSLGGRIGLGAALRTDAIRRLVVYEGAPPPPSRTYETTGLVERLEDLLERGDKAEIVRAFMRAVVGMSETDLLAFESTAVWPLRVEAAHTIPRELRAQAGSAASLDALGDVRIPVLQILGGASRPVFAEAVAALDTRLRDGRVAVLADQRHNAHHAAVDGFVGAVREFLDEPDR